MKATLVSEYDRSDPEKATEYFHGMKCGNEISILFQKKHKKGDEITKNEIV